MAAGAAEGAQTNHSAAVQAFEDVGYSVRTFVISPHQVGIPQVRNRVWYVLVNTARYEKVGMHGDGKVTLEMRLDKVMRTVESFKDPSGHSYSLCDFLFDDGSEQLELTRDALSVKLAERTDPKRRKKETNKWLDLHAGLYKKHGLKWIHPSDNRILQSEAEDNVFLASLTDRERDIVHFVDLVRPPLAADSSEEVFDLLPDRMTRYSFIVVLESLYV